MTGTKKKKEEHRPSICAPPPTVSAVLPGPVTGQGIRPRPAWSSREALPPYLALPM